MDVESLTIRTATEQDQPAIRAVHESAFETSLEADIAEALHEAGDERISLVAVDGDAVVGHVVLSAGRVGAAVVLCLGPIGVRVEHQGAGVGTALMRAAIDAAEATGAGLVVLLGHPTYYPRFGFEPAAPLGLTGQWTQEAPWMALRLAGYDPSVRGFVRFPPAFDADPPDRVSAE
jgi:putative acetyltransferase